MNKTLMILLATAFLYSCSSPKKKEKTKFEPTTTDKMVDSLKSMPEDVQPTTQAPVTRFTILSSDEAVLFKTNIDPDAQWWTAGDMDMYAPVKRPRWSMVLDNYPRKRHDGSNESEELYHSVGGVVAALYDADPDGCTNTCALRVSVALNKAGVAIPSKKDHTYRGSDGKYYFLSAAKLFHWMLESFGKPEVYHEKASGFEWDQALDEKIIGKKGIYIIQAKNRMMFGASGHADLVDERECIGGNCYFNLSGGAIRVGVWTLKD